MGYSEVMAARRRRQDPLLIIDSLNLLDVGERNGEVKWMADENRRRRRFAAQWDNLMREFMAAGTDEAKRVALHELWLCLHEFKPHIECELKEVPHFGGVELIWDDTTDTIPDVVLHTCSVVRAVVKHRYRPRRWR